MYFQIGIQLKQYVLPLLTNEVELLLAVEGVPLESHGPVHGHAPCAAHTGNHTVRPTVNKLAE